MKITFLGTGTSSGVPMICCDCAVCTSKDTRNRRLRASVYVEADGQCIVLDTAPDFREQCLRYRIRQVDAVLFTHAHADHVFGFDEIRRFNSIQDCRIPAYASAGTMEELRRIFKYIIENVEVGVYRPKIDFHEISGKFSIGNISVEEFEVQHGASPASGYLIQSGGKRFGYVPDCLEMSDSVVDRLKGVDLMVLDALRYRPHPTHLTIEAATQLLQRIGAKQSYLTHIGHDVDFEEASAKLPDGIQLSYDGLVVEL